jgi:hypothetical protein
MVICNYLILHKKYQLSEDTPSAIFSHSSLSFLADNFAGQGAHRANN